MSRLPPKPALSWSADGAPRAESFNDIYFSRDGGLSETEAVFFAGCDLPARWRAGRAHALCELGFGAGLNALATWRLWARTRPPGAVLHYVSIEAFPMAREEAARALGLFPELAPYAARLLADWPARAYAPQRFWFEADGFALTVVHGDAAEALAGLQGRFDSWFLDGFAPARNPEMWGEKITRRIAALSAPGAQLASYSVAGAVRRALTEAGFAVEKRPGFAAKRERLEARLARPPNPPYALYPYGATKPPERVAIIGAGIAGAALARALRRRGVAATVLESAGDAAAGASGNRVGLVMPRLDRGRGPVQELYLAAYLDAVRAYAGALEACGVEERAREDLHVDPPLPPDWLAALDNGAVLHRRAGVLAPREIVAQWLEGAELRPGARAMRLDAAGGGWVVRDAEGTVLTEADAVVLANGARLDQFEQTAWLDLRLTAGQVEEARAPGPARALLGESYVAPFDGGFVFGATFDRVADADAEPAPDARGRNLAALKELAPELAAGLDPATLHSRSAIRAAAPDYAPIAGLAPDTQVWLTRQAGIARGRPPDLSLPAAAHGGLYLFGGLGARGLTLAPLLAEKIAAEMFGEPQILLQPALDALNPARFLHRKVKKGLTIADRGALHDDESERS